MPAQPCACVRDVSRDSIRRFSHGELMSPCDKLFFLGHFLGSNPRPPASFLLLRTGKGMKLLDLFSGGKSVTRVAESLGYTVTTLDMNKNSNSASAPLTNPSADARQTSSSAYVSTRDSRRLCLKKIRPTIKQ